MNRAAAIIPCLLLAVVLVYALCTLLELLRLRFVEPVCMRLIDRIPPVRRELGKGRAALKKGPFPRTLRGNGPFLSFAQPRSVSRNTR